MNTNIEEQLDEFAENLEYIEARKRLENELDQDNALNFSSELEVDDRFNEA